MKKPTINPDNDNQKIETEEIKPPKNDRFFPDADLFESFCISVYKVEKHGKRILIDEYDDYIPDVKELRDTYGGGTYEFYAFQIRDGKKLSDVLDTKQVHVADLNPPEKSIGPTKKEIIEELKLLSEITGKGGDSTAILQLILQMNKQQNENMVSLLKAQQESESRFNALLLDIQKNNQNKDKFTDIIEAVQIIDSLRGDKSESMTEKMLSSLIPALAPAVGPALLSLTKQPTGTIAPAITPNEPKKIQKKPVNKEEIFNLIISNTSPDIKKKITTANRGPIKDFIINKYHINAIDADVIINKIIAENTN